MCTSVCQTIIEVSLISWWSSHRLASLKTHTYKHTHTALLFSASNTLLLLFSFVMIKGLHDYSFPSYIYMHTHIHIQTFFQFPIYKLESFSVFQTR